MAGVRAPETQTAMAAIGSHDPRQFGLLDYYLTSVLAGFRALPGPYPRQAIARIVNPLSYPRYMEYRIVQELLGNMDGGPVLDIGSPKLPILLLAKHCRSEIFATDIRDYFIGPTAHLLTRTGSGARLGVDLHLETQDARSLSYADASFDHIFAISVLEHIPDDGDSVAAREIARVLRPGGNVAVTVPFRAEGHWDEYVAGDVFERRANGTRTFFQRRYDLTTLRTRLIEPSGLTVTAVIPFGEPLVPFERYWNRIPIHWKLPLLWAAPFVAQAFLRRLPMSRIDAACGIALRLTKPAS